MTNNRKDHRIRLRDKITPRTSLLTWSDKAFDEHRSLLAR